jgi:phage protein U
MGQIGCLGDIVFTVSSDMVETIQNVQWAGSVRYAEHQRHNNNALTEFTGINADTVSFDMLLSAYLGVKVMNELVKIWTYERKGTSLPLVIGEKPYGKYRWVIKNHKIKMQTFDKAGNIIMATVSLNLLEYLNV